MSGTRRIPRPLWFLFAGTTVIRAGAFVVPYLTLYLTAELGLSLSVTGQVVAMGGVGLLVGNLLGGWLTDRVGRKPTLLAALCVNALGVTTLAMPWSTPLAYALALGGALLGAGMYLPAANALIADMTSEDARPFAYTVHYVCINVGMGLGPLLGGFVAASSFAWLFAGDVISTLACAVLIAVGLRVVGRPTTNDDAPRSTSTLQVWRAHPVVVMFCAASVFMVAPLMGFEYAVPLLVGREFAAPLLFVGLVYSINAACILALSFPIEKALRGRDEAAMMGLAGMLWVAGLTILFVGHSVAALLLCTVVWTAGEIIGSIVIPTFVSRRVAPDAKGRMLGLQDAVRSLCGIGCPLLLGAVWDAQGVHAAVGVMTVLPAIGVVAYGMIWLAATRPAAVTAGAP